MKKIISNLWTFLFAIVLVGLIVSCGEDDGDSTASDSIAPTSVNLIYTPATATTNFLGIGSMLHFYAPVENQWLVNGFFVPTGTGATGAFTVS